MRMFIDSHAHLTGHTVIDHVEEMLERAQQHQVKAIVNICTDQHSLKKGSHWGRDTGGFSMQRRQLLMMW